MNNEFEYISIRNILADVASHPLLQDVDLEAGIQYTLRFFAIVGVPEIYEDRIDCVEIHNFKGHLPCDTIQVRQVRDERTKQIMRSMTDSFNGHSRGLPGGAATFKTQNRVIVTSFPEGKVLISYRAIKTDDDGLPMLPDDQIFLDALKAYIKRERLSILFDTGKINRDIMMRTDQDYSWKVGKCINRFKMPSISEMQSITNMLHRMIPSTREFEAGFKGMGDKEHYKLHR